MQWTTANDLVPKGCLEMIGLSILIFGQVVNPSLCQEVPWGIDFTENLEDIESMILHTPDAITVHGSL